MAPTIRRVAVIGAGPSGAAAAEALRQTGVFDLIRVFERRAEAGGSWNFDASPKVPPADPLLHPSVADPPLKPPEQLPAETPKNETRERWVTAPVYENLTTNVNIEIMSYVYVHFSEVDDKKTNDPDPMFPSAARVLSYIQALHKRHEDCLVLNTAVESAVKHGSEWRLILRRSDTDKDYWYEESFDALVVATGIYSTPKIPFIPGLKEYNLRFPGRALHSKYFRSVEPYRNKSVIIVGNGITALDLIRDLMLVTSRLTVSHRSPNWMYPTALVDVPGISVRSELDRVDSETGEWHFKDGGSPVQPDVVIFATGYLVSFPFLQPPYATHNHDTTGPTNWVPGTYLHTFWRNDPTLSFVGLIQNSISFRVFAYQAALVAAYLAGSLALPSTQEMEEWEKRRLVEVESNTALFHYNKYPDSVAFLNQLQSILASANAAPEGMKLLPWQDEWTQPYLNGVNERKRRVNNLKMLHITGTVL